MNATFTVGESYGALAKFSTYPKILVEGPRGTSKSRSILGYFLAKLFEYPGARLLICRRYRAELTKTILTTLEDEVFPAFGIPVPGGPHRGGRSEYLLPNGSVIWPAGVDDGMGALSMGVTFAYCAEVIEMDEETVTDIAGGLRWLRSDERPLLPEHSQLIMDCNPSAPGHWANQIAEPVKDTVRRVTTVDDYLRLQEHNYRPAADPVTRWKRIITRHQDNPGYWDHDAWDYKPLGRNYVTQQLEGYRGAKRERWLHGLWKAAEGSVFPEFEEEKHKVAAFKIPAGWPGILACDPGYAHVLAMPIASIAPNGRIYIVAEHVKAGMTIPQHSAWLTAFEAAAPFIIRKKLGDPHDMFKKTLDGNGRSKAEQFMDFGHHFVPAPAASNAAQLSAQVEMVRTLLVTNLSDGLPALQIFDTCPMTIAALQSWAYKRNAKGELAGSEDQYEEAYKDEMDGVRMIVADKPAYNPPAWGVSMQSR